MNTLVKITEQVSPQAAHAVGIGSGATGLAIWLEWAKHLTVFAGALAALFAALGGLFYGVYWACRAYCAVKKVLAGDNVE